MIDMGLTEQNLFMIQQLVQGSAHLQELDVSHNSLGSRPIKNLIEALSENRFLKSLNLSWNKLLDRSETEEEQDEILEQL